MKATIETLIKIDGEKIWEIEAIAELPKGWSISRLKKSLRAGFRARAYRSGDENIKNYSGSKIYTITASTISVGGIFG